MLLTKETVGDFSETEQGETVLEGTLGVICLHLALSKQHLPSSDDFMSTLKRTSSGLGKLTVDERKQNLSGLFGKKQEDNSVTCIIKVKKDHSDARGKRTEQHFTYQLSKTVKEGRIKELSEKTDPC